MDPLTQLLDGPQARRAFLLRAVMQAPWRLQVQDEAALTLVLVSGAPVTLESAGRQLTLLTGDTALIRGGAPYVISDPSGATDRATAVIHPGQRCTGPDGEELDVLFHRGLRSWGNAPDPERCDHTLLIGTYESPGEVGRLAVDALPAVAVVPVGRTDRALTQILHREVLSHGPAQSTLLDRLLDAVLIDTIRTWLQDNPSAEPGWLSGQQDPAISLVLGLIHDHPERPWTLDQLARSAAVSRAGLAARFRHQVGVPPITYLTRWRLARAADLLADPSSTIARIATQVGYSSPFSLSTAFKNRYGTSPHRYRRTRYQAGRGSTEIELLDQPVDLDDGGHSRPRKSR